MNNATINERIKKMIFGAVYPLYLAKVEKKVTNQRRLRSCYQMVNWDLTIKWKKYCDKIRHYFLQLLICES
jgi:hypothetical protein